MRRRFSAVLALASIGMFSSSAAAQDWHVTDRGVLRIAGAGYWGSTTLDFPDSAPGTSSRQHFRGAWTELSYFMRPGLALGVSGQLSSSDGTFGDQTSNSALRSIGPVVTLFPMVAFSSGPRRAVHAAAALQPYVSAAIELMHQTTQARIPAYGYTYDGHSDRTQLVGSLGIVAMFSRQVGLDIALQYWHDAGTDHTTSTGGGGPFSYDDKYVEKTLQLYFGIAAYVKP